MDKVEGLEKIRKSGSDPAVDLSNPDVAAIVQIANDFCEAWKNGDLATIMDAYSSDVIKISQGAANRGKEDLERGYRELLSECSVRIEVQIEEVKILSLRWRLTGPISR
jgi:ketosteroid isomerase-like protein